MRTKKQGGEGEACQKSLFLRNHIYVSPWCLTTSFLDQGSQSDLQLGFPEGPLPEVVFPEIKVWLRPPALRPQLKCHRLKEASLTSLPKAVSFSQPASYNRIYIFLARSPSCIILFTYYSLLIHGLCHMCTVQVHPLPPKINTESKLPP